MLVQEAGLVCWTYVLDLASRASRLSWTNSEIGCLDKKEPRSRAVKKENERTPTDGEQREQFARLISSGE